MTENGSSTKRPAWLATSEKYWWVFVGAGISMFLQGFVFLIMAAVSMNVLTGMDSEQAALIIFDWMMHSPSLAAQVFSVSSHLQNYAIVPILIGVAFKLNEEGL